MKKIVLVVMVLVLAGAIYFAFKGNDDTDVAQFEAPITQPTGSYLTGMRDLQGKVVPMEEDKLVFLNVWATWCGPCNMEMPGIQSLYDKYKDNDKVAFYIVSDEDAATVNPFVERKGYQLPFYQYVGPYPSALDGNAIPRTYIIHKGEIVAQEVGASQWDRPEVHQLIEEKIAEI
ncbi:TlpA family protein disulfide reductase [Dyadobacter jejuensis]|nr:TlpA disulfide reductase family protein [Dyadobacter jejuensis]